MISYLDASIILSIISIPILSSLSTYSASSIVIIASFLITILNCILLATLITYTPLSMNESLISLSTLLIIIYQILIKI